MLKNDTHEIEAYADLMAKIYTRVIYHHQRGLRGILETYLSLFEHSDNQILARTPCNQFYWIETAATGHFMIKGENFITPIPQDTLN